MKRLERALKKSVDVSAVGMKVFGNSISDPLFHETVTVVGKSLLSRQVMLRQLVEQVGLEAMNTGDAASILLPEHPKVAAFVRGATFFAYEGLFQQHGKTLACADCF